MFATAARILSADHELAPSTLAARVAAAFRADPYAVVGTGLGPASGSWPTGSSGAPSEVESLLVEAEGRREDLERFLDRLRQGPPMAEVRDIDHSWERGGGNFSRWELRW